MSSSLRSVAFSAFRFGGLSSLSLASGSPARVSCWFLSGAPAARFAARWGVAARLVAGVWCVSVSVALVAGVPALGGCISSARVAGFGLRGLVAAVASLAGAPVVAAPRGWAWARR